MLFYILPLFSIRSGEALSGQSEVKRLDWKLGYIPIFNGILSLSESVLESRIRMGLWSDRARILRS